MNTIAETQTEEQLTASSEKRSLRHGVDEEDESLSELELCRKYSKMGSMEQD